MANPEQLRILRQGVETWNQWRVENLPYRWIAPGLDATDFSLEPADFGLDLAVPDLAGANFHGVDLHRAYLSGANLHSANLTDADLSATNLHRAYLYKATLQGANLSRANLSEANLSQADLRGLNLQTAYLHRANLQRANLSDANLSDANLIGSNLSGANLSRAKLNGVDLSSAILVGTNLENADLTGCRVYGVSAWSLKLAGTVQKNLIITSPNEPTIQVDRLDIAQFTYLLLNNADIRHVIDTITSKVVLILGRFTEERKNVLDALRTALRDRDYLPILFDWEKPSNRDITETVSTLAHMAKFVIADITEARSIPQELMAIVPNLPSVPVQPLLLASQREYGMFKYFKRYPWMLPVALYENQEELLGSLEQKVIAPAEAKLQELRTFSAAANGEPEVSWGT